MRISVIMPSYLGDYEGAATNRIEKFKRAVRSFLGQNHRGAELIVISDGCERTNAAFVDMFIPAELQALEEKGTPVRLITLEKQAPFSGAVRNAGIDASQGEIICYLDIDDVFLAGHLLAIDDAFLPNPERPYEYKRWVYFNDFLANPDLTIFRERQTNLIYGGIGTGGFAHEKTLAVQWPDGYGHDWGVVRQLLLSCPATKKIFGPRYLVCHLAPGIDY